MIHEECKTCTKIQEMIDESGSQILRYFRNESKGMVLGGKVLHCKVCSHKDFSAPISGVSTIEASNMVLKSIKKKCDNLHHSETNPGTHVSQDNIAFPPLTEKCDIMTYHYPLDDLSSNSHFYYNCDV